MISKEKKGSENNQDDANYSGFENKPCQKCLKEQREAI